MINATYPPNKFYLLEYGDKYSRFNPLITTRWCPQGFFSTQIKMVDLHLKNGGTSSFNSGKSSTVL